MIKALCFFTLNLLLPGTGFIYTPSKTNKANTDGNNHINPNCDLLITQLKPASRYWLLLLSTLLGVSWSGLIFSPNGFYYLLAGYVLVAMLSSVHLIFFRYNLFLKKTTTLMRDMEHEVDQTSSIPKYPFKPITFRLLPFIFVPTSFIFQVTF